MFQMPLTLIGTGFLTGMFQWGVIFIPNKSNRDSRN